MRHRKARKKLGRTYSHRHAMFGNLLAALAEHGRIQTTERKAKELRRLAERAITHFTRLGDLLLKDPESFGPEDSAKVVHALRVVRRNLKDRSALLKLYDNWAPRFLGRPGGYTRMFKMGPRRGDSAPMAVVEFVPAEMPEREGRGEKKVSKKA
ncbi:MAG: 50S ribosomal protein L17 [Pseudomonadota bacterium]